MATMEINPENFKTMRDINDYCVQNNIPSLAQGMIELPPPIKLREIASKIVLEDGIHTYRNRFGEAQFREAIVSLLDKEYETSVGSDAILTTQGVSGGIVATLALLNSKGKSRIGIVEPFYTYHIFQIKRIFGESKEPVYVKPNEDLSPNFDNIEKALEEGLDLLIVCNPGNPSGRVWTEAELDKVVELTGKANCTLLLDECYSDMVWVNNKHFYSPIQKGLKDNLIVARGFSKVLGAQSWRVGYTVSSPAVVAELMKVADPIYICVSWVQHALGYYISENLVDFQDHKNKVGDLIRSNWKVISEAIQKAFGWEPIEPGGTMYGMFKHAEKSDMEAVVKALKKGVGLCPGSMFFAGFPEHTGYVRIHCGVSEAKAKDVVARLLS